MSRARSVMLIALAAFAVPAAARATPPVEPQIVSTAGEFASLPDVAIGRTGRTVVAWEVEDGTERRPSSHVEVALGSRPGRLGHPRALPDSDGPADVAVSPDGTAFACWGTGSTRIGCAVAPRGGHFRRSPYPPAALPAAP